MTSQELNLSAEAESMDALVTGGEDMLNEWLKRTNPTARDAFGALNLIRFYRDQVERGQFDESLSNSAHEAVKLLTESVHKLGFAFVWERGEASQEVTP